MKRDAEENVRVGSVRLPLVDALRALAALSIFGYHALFVTGNLHPGSYGWFLNVGVPLFYAISGFLLYRPWSQAIIDQGSPATLRVYARHRVLRIVPAYWVALPLVAVLLSRVDQVFTPGGLVTYFGFLQMYSLRTFTGGIGQAWTLGVEVAFYVFLPIFGLAVARFARTGNSIKSRANRQFAAIGLLVVFSFVWKVFAIAVYGASSRDVLIPLTVLPAALDQFAVGMLVAVALTSAVGASSAANLVTICRKRPWLPSAAALGAFVLLGVVGQGVGPFYDQGIQVGGGGGLLVEHELKAVIGLGLVLAAVCAQPGRGLIGRTLAFAPLRNLGTVSYGFYLWHLCLLIIFAGAITMGNQVKWVGGSEGLIGGLPGVLVAFMSSVLVSVASWRLLEKRMISRSHRNIPSVRNGFGDASH